MPRPLSIIMIIVGFIDMVIGMGFLVNPSNAGAEFGLTASSVEGLSALRADFTAFFLVGGGALVFAGWSDRRGWLAVPLALFGIAFIGRLINLAILGAYEGWWIPMLVEAFHVFLCIVCMRRGRRRVHKSLLD